MEIGFKMSNLGRTSGGLWVVPGYVINTCCNLSPTFALCHTMWCCLSGLGWGSPGLEHWSWQLPQNDSTQSYWLRDCKGTYTHTEHHVLASSLVLSCKSSHTACKVFVCMEELLATLPALLSHTKIFILSNPQCEKCGKKFSLIDQSIPEPCLCVFCRLRNRSLEQLSEHYLK